MVEDLHCQVHIIETGYFLFFMALDKDRRTQGKCPLKNIIRLYKRVYYIVIYVIMTKGVEKI
jgi:hypothetical protein